MTDTTSGGLTDASASTQLDAGASVTTETGSAGVVDASGSTSVDTTVAPVDTGTTLTDTRLETPGTYGFMVVKADSLDEAIAIAREAPHMALGGSTIVRPCIEIPR